MNLKEMSNQAFLQSFSVAVQSERKITANVIEYVKEMDRRRLYLEMGFTSLFQFLTEHMGYTPGSAQRRIDSARMLRDVPELKKKIESGEINLMQISTLARAVREKEKTESVTVETKREILATIETLDVMDSEQKIAQMLDVAIKTKEIRRFQKDESVRIEVTFSKEQTELLAQVKSLISHSHLDPSLPEVFEFLAKQFVQKKMGQQKRGKEKAQTTATMAVAEGEKPTNNVRSVPAQIKRQIQEAQSCCQWKVDGQVCGSTFQLQIDHIQPIWAGGDSRRENLQILCAVHNRLRYREQSGIKRRA